MCQERNAVAHHTQHRAAQAQQVRSCTLQHLATPHNMKCTQDSSNLQFKGLANYQSKKKNEEESLEQAGYYDHRGLPTFPFNRIEAHLLFLLLRAL